MQVIDDKILTTTLEKYWGHSSFRYPQQEIIKDILEGNDVLALMRTGFGKSNLYQLPSLLLDGITLVISPLKSLQKDQVDACIEKGIPAALLNSDTGIRAKRVILKDIETNVLKLLYISPETLFSEGFKQFKDVLTNVSLIAVDESHCCSSWSDFRPAYQKIYLAREELFPNATLLAVTATADQNIISDIVKYTGLKEDHKTYKTTFDRSTISYNIIKILNKDKILKTINHLISKHNNQAGIVFCNTQKDAEQYSSILKTLGKNCAYFHAKMKKKDKEQVQEDFIAGKIDIVFATIAFGMGVDKAQPLDTPVLTPSGFLPLKDIHVGDTVITSKGSVANVVHVHDVGLTEAVTVTLKDQTKTICALDHMWLVREDDQYIVRDTAYLLKHSGKSFSIPAYRLDNYTSSIIQKATNFYSKYSSLKPSFNFLVETLEEYESIRDFTLSIGGTVTLDYNRVTVNLPIQNNKNLTREIDSVVLNNTKTEMKCITIDSIESLYVANDYIVTHNCDIRFVIHAGVPSNFEEYSQAVGRASRDLKPSVAYLLYTATSYNSSLWMIRKSTLNLDRLNIKIKKLTQFHKFCTSNVCRRKGLLEYFGEDYTHDNCNSCDVCLNKKGNVNEQLY